MDNYINQNLLPILMDKYSVQIKEYGIRSVTITDGHIDIDSIERIPYELFSSIECELL